MADVYRWVSPTFPYSGTKLWAATAEAGSRGKIDSPAGGFASIVGTGIPAGQYEPRVLRFGKITFGSDFSSSPSLRFPQWQVVIDDTDQMLSCILASGENILRSPVTQGAAYVANGAVVNSWVVSGVISGAPQRSGEMQWSIPLQTDDSAFNREILYPIRQQDFPNAPLQALQHKVQAKAKKHTLTTNAQPVFGIPAPIIYGLHDSAGTPQQGACPVIHVDNVNFYGLVAWGRVTILRVYKAGVRQTFPSASIAAAYPVIGGQLYTVLAFSTDQSASTFTVDVQGYESVGDGSGTPLNACADQMLHFLRNVACIGTAPPVRGAWNTSGGNVIAADFALSALSKRAGGSGYIGSRHISAATTALQEINSWAQTWQLHPFISPAGLLGIQHHDPQLSAVNWSDGNRWYRYSQRDFEDLAMEFDQSGFLGKVTVEPPALATGGSALSSLTVMNPLSKSQASESLSMPWGPAFQ